MSLFCSNCPITPRLTESQSQSLKWPANPARRGLLPNLFLSYFPSLAGLCALPQAWTCQAQPQLRTLHLLFHLPGTAPGVVRLTPSLPSEVYSVRASFPVPINNKPLSCLSTPCFPPLLFFFSWQLLLSRYYIFIWYFLLVLHLLIGL